VSESRLVFLREGKETLLWRTSFPEKFWQNNEKRQNFKAREKEKEEEEEEIQQQQVWRKLISLSFSL